MSSRKDSRKKKGPDPRAVGGREHWHYISTYRHNLMRTIHDIRSGKVKEADLDKLQNYLQMSLRLAASVNLDVLGHAWRDVEIMAWIHDDNPDLEVVLLDAKNDPQAVRPADLGGEGNSSPVTKLVVGG